MCFSAGASFAASSVLLVVGIVTIRKASTPAQRLLACIPLFFSFQQFIEGVLWVSLQNTAYASLQVPSTYGFLMFAQVIWPIMVPLAILQLEHEPRRKKMLHAFLACGIITSLFLFYCIVVFPVSAVIGEHHIKYELDFPKPFMIFCNIFYFIPTVISPLISSMKKLRWLGLTILVSYIISRVFYQNYVISVWCYFAAVISIVVLLIIFSLNKPKRTT